jgi:hypothetical protein
MQVVLSKDWKDTDLLHLFQSGDFSDCTFKVGQEDEGSGCKVCNYL